MNRGILQLAASGKLPLELEYRMLATPLGDLFTDIEAFEGIDPNNTSLMSDAFELTYGEY